MATNNIIQCAKVTDPKSESPKVVNPIAGLLTVTNIPRNGNRPIIPNITGVFKPTPPTIVVPKPKVSPVVTRLIISKPEPKSVDHIQNQDQDQDSDRSSGSDDEIEYKPKMEESDPEPECEELQRENKEQPILSIEERLANMEKKVDRLINMDEKLDMILSLLNRPNTNVPSLPRTIPTPKVQMANLPQLPKLHNTSLNKDGASLGSNVEGPIMEGPTIYKEYWGQAFYSKEEYEEFYEKKQRELEEHEKETLRKMEERKFLDNAVLPKCASKNPTLKLKSKTLSPQSIPHNQPQMKYTEDGLCLGTKKPTDGLVPSEKEPGFYDVITDVSDARKPKYAEGHEKLTDEVVKLLSWVSLKKLMGSFKSNRKRNPETRKYLTHNQNLVQEEIRQRNQKHRESKFANREIDSDEEQEQEQEEPPAIPKKSEPSPKRSDSQTPPIPKIEFTNNESKGESGQSIQPAIDYSAFDDDPPEEVAKTNRVHQPTSDLDFFRDKIQTRGKTDFKGKGPGELVPAINSKGKINLIDGTRAAGDLTKGRQRMIDPINYTNNSLLIIRRCCYGSLNCSKSQANYVSDPVARENIKFTFNMCEAECRKRGLEMPQLNAYDRSKAMRGRVQHMN